MASLPVVKPALVLLVAGMGLAAAAVSTPAVVGAETPLEADESNERTAKLNGPIANFGRVPFQNGSRIEASEMSPDGKLLATLSARSATVWQTTTGQPLHRFFFDIPARPGYQRGLAFSPDSKRLACGPSSEHVFVWDLAGGKQLRRFVTEFEMFAYSFLRFSADGASVIVESNDVLSWLNVETGATGRGLQFGRIKQLSADEKAFVIVQESKQQVLIGDTTTGKVAHILPIAARFDAAQHGVLFLPDRTTLAVVHHLDDSSKEVQRKEVQFWDITTGKRRDRTWSLPPVDRWGDYRLSLSPDGKVLYFLGGRWSLEAGKELEPLPIPIHYWTRAAFPHPDGKTLFSVGRDELRRWDLASGKEISKDEDFLKWHEAAISPDGRWLAQRGCSQKAWDGFLELCDTESKKVERIALPWGNGATLAITADSRALVVNEYNHLQFLTVPQLTGGKRFTPAEQIGNATLHCSADGRYLAVVRGTGLLRLYDLTTDKEIWSLEDTARTLFTPDGKGLLARSRKDGALRLHELATKKVLFNVEPPPDRGGRRRGGPGVSAWAFSPDGKTLAVAMTGGHVCLLDAATGKERFRFLSMPTGKYDLISENYLQATALAFSADGKWLGAGGRDGFLRIWEVSTRRELHRLHGHDGAARLLCFSADGRRLVSWGDGEGLLWDLRPSSENLKGLDPLLDLLSRDGPTVYRAVWAMAEDPKGPATLRERIPPKRVDARPERIALLIADLSAEQFKRRNAAMRSLAEMEENARPALIGALQKNPSLEMKRRIEMLLGELDTPTEPALQISRAVQAMALHASDTARTLLQDWSEGTPGLGLTEEARAVLARRGTEPSTGK
jgi:WD40 repeat protein